VASEIVVRSARALVGDALVPAAVRVRDGRIVAIEGRDAPANGADAIDVGDRALVPALVDTHVHVNEPGRTEWEGFVTATRAAAAGGITTVVDMPLNCTPVTTTRAALDLKKQAAHGKNAVDLMSWGGVVPGNARELSPMIDAGVPGFKCFLVHSGIDDFPRVDERDLVEAMPVLAQRGSVLLVHAEVPGPIDAACEELTRTHADPHAYATFLRSRPRASEDRAIEMMIDLSKRTGCRVHIVHLSSASALPILAAAKRDGVRITVETCPHYLTFTAEDVPPGETQYKCCPPIRERDNREQLWRGLRDGIIDMVVSDHSPCTPALKKRESGDFMDAWGGIAGLQFGLSAIWTEAKSRGFSLVDVVRWMSARTAALARVDDRKGSLAVGKDADFVVFDPEASFDVTADRVKHRHALTPYAGRTLFGVVEKTFLRGEEITEKTSGDWIAPSEVRT
jgi:allantoinase